MPCGACGAYSTGGTVWFWRWIELYGRHGLCADSGSVPLVCPTVCGDAYWSGPGVECRRGVGVVRAYNAFNHFTRFARSVGRVSLVLVFWVSM